MSLLVTNDVSLTEKLCGFDFTVYWILDSLAKNDEIFKEQFAKKTITKVNARDISANKGFFSTVLKIELVFHDGTKYTTILKIPGTESFAAAKITENVEDIKLGASTLTDSIIRMHDTECDFYENVAYLIPEILPKVHKFKRWVKGVHIGCLHMEDLSVKGRNLDYFDGLTVPQFKNVIDWLAYFHSKLLTTDTWQGKFTKQGKIFSQMREMFKTGFNKSVDIVRTGKEKFESLIHDERIQKILYNQEFIDYAFFESYRDFGLPKLLVHSDLWASNMIFEANEEGDATDKVSAVLDWQITFEGNFLFDFARLMICSLEGDIRREMEEIIFDFYVTRLNKYLKENGGKEVTFTPADVKRTYEHMFLAHFGHGIIMFGGIFKGRSRDLDKDKVELARLEKCTLRSIHFLEDVINLLESGKFDRWL